MARSVATYMPHCGSLTMCPSIVRLVFAERVEGRGRRWLPTEKSLAIRLLTRINRSRKRSSRISQVIVQERSSCRCFPSCFLISVDTQGGCSTSVTEVEGEQTTVFELRVSQSDLGKVIGKHGRTALAIRTSTSTFITPPCEMNQKRDLGRTVLRCCLTAVGEAFLIILPRGRGKWGFREADAVVARRE